MSDERYVMVTAVSTHRMRYCVPMSELQKLNPEGGDLFSDYQKAIEWANDSVTAEDVKEFSQEWLGEQIVDTFILDEERALQMFDRDNDYLKEWTKEQKLKHIHDWKETWKKS